MKVITSELLRKFFNKLSDIFAKKTDIKSVNINNNLTTTDEGYALDARQGKALNDSITSLKKSVSDGKSAIASAITTKGVSTASDASFDTMASNIRNLLVGNTLLDYLKFNMYTDYHYMSNKYLLTIYCCDTTYSNYGSIIPYEGNEANYVNIWYICPDNGVGMLNIETVNGKERLIFYDYKREEESSTTGLYYFSVKIYNSYDKKEYIYDHVTRISTSSFYDPDGIYPYENHIGFIMLGTSTRPTFR